MSCKVCIVATFTALLQFCTGFQPLKEEMVVSSSELTVFTLSPSTFKWELNPDILKQIEYFPRKSNYPDLPSWLHYTYDDLTSIGHLYGLPPRDTSTISIDIVAINRNFSFEHRTLTLIFNVIPQPPLEYVVELKIDNMEARDFCNTKQILRLAKTLSNFLNWNRLDGTPVTPVFLANAADLGEIDYSRAYRAQGVIIHLGSDQNFSSEMAKLFQEVLPLAKLRPCPQNLKRTSVEKYFRSQRLIVDWCSFRLKTLVERNANKGQDGLEEVKEFGDISSHIPPLRTALPEKSYTSAVLLATIVPAAVACLLGFILIGIFWNDEDDSQVNGDVIFFETAFRTLSVLFSCKGHTQNFDDPGTLGGVQRGSYQTYPEVVMGEDDNFFLITGDDSRPDPVDPDGGRHTRAESLPRYVLPSAMHPNGSPALTYAV